MVVDFDLETFAFGVTAVHAKEHLRPVLCFGATATCVDIEETIGIVGFARKHALEFDFGERGICAINVAFDAPERGFIAFTLGKFEEFCRALRIGREFVDRLDNTIERAFFFAKITCAIRVAPYVRVFEFGVNFL
jgi:hypothetical protein